MIDIGKHDVQVTIKTITTGSGAMGGPDDSEATLATVWAIVTEVGGNERYSGMQEIHSDDRLVRMIWMAGVTDVVTTKGHKIYIDGDEFDILHLTEIGRKVELELVVRRVT